MGSVLDMSNTLRAEGFSTKTQLGLDAVERKGPVKAQPRLTATEARNREAAQLICDAMGAYGPDALAAAMSEGSERAVDKTQVSRWRAGTESAPLRSLLPLLKDERAALVLLTAMANYAGLAPPRPIQKVTRRQVEESIARKTRQCVVLWRQMARDAADDLGTTLDDVEAAMAETA
jgi:hypothetical protein